MMLIVEGFNKCFVIRLNNQKKFIHLLPVIEREIKERKKGELRRNCIIHNF